MESPPLLPCQGDTRLLAPGPLDPISSLLESLLTALYAHSNDKSESNSFDWTMGLTAG